MLMLINKLLRKGAWLFVLAVIVTITWMAIEPVKSKWKDLDTSELTKLINSYSAQADQLRAAKADIEKHVEDAKTELVKLVPRPNSASSQIKGQLDTINKRLENSKNEKKALGVLDFQKKIEFEIQIELLRQASSYTTSLLESVRDMEASRQNLATLLAEAKNAEADLKQKQWEQTLNNEEKKKLADKYTIPVFGNTFPMASIPFTDEYQQMKVLKIKSNALKRDIESLEIKFKNAETLYEDKKRFIDQMKNPGGWMPDAASSSIRKAMQRLNDKIEGVDKEIKNLKHGLQQREQHWIWQIYKSGKETFPTALWYVCMAFIATPYIIKLLAFYVAAPLAARRPGTTLLPESSGLIQFADNVAAKRISDPRTSTVSKSIILNDKSELLVLPEYLQSASLNAKKETKLLLDWSMPLTSLASGMYGLTRISAGGTEPVVISSSKDPLIEISEIDLPACSAVVLQPRCLVGIVQRPDTPIHIKRYWRFGLSNWLTLQLRHVVFHGPARLIVKGCRGIRIEPVNAGRAINQAATLGYSANLQYAVSRCETFYPYLTGSQELFNDRFSGQPGYCIYEETPHPNANTGVTGRGIEGVIDSVLKVFGI
jgi:hypothetical protein